MNRCFRPHGFFFSFRRALGLVAALAFLSPCLSAGRTRHHSLSASDADYVSALATANRFLYAWQVHDEETGVLLLSEAAKKNSSEEKVDAFFTIAPVATYEIGRGMKLKPGRYSFPLALYTFDRGTEAHCHPRHSHLSVVKTGKEDWAIDTLP